METKAVRLTGFRNATPSSSASTRGARGNNSSLRRRGLRLALFRTSARERAGGGAHGQNDVWSNCEVTRVRSKVHLSHRSCTTQQRWLGNPVYRNAWVIRAPQAKDDH
ncbi:hypothetical protein OPV22_020764 [Ensete ventricosum]|uniref:Uncharacterized protein n=1 Tax=Ensete ventricosum TaxID=4639 RepID=A0AAV8QP24_ENSVE|nr:hypothetical protein OPV22_020764 [Ensete ventricosum]RWV79387.1 hypothetical protein GW17_00059487 [Ensete ventricosum]